MAKKQQIFMLTDGCIWEMNKITGGSNPHSIEVVDVETGSVRYIKSGSRIMFVEGEISEGRNQKLYNKMTTPPKE